MKHRKQIQEQVPVMGHHPMITRSKLKKKQVPVMGHHHMITRSKQRISDPISQPVLTRRKKSRGEKKNSIVNRQPIHLPVEIITEILIRLPVDSLLRCKRVCKQWYDLIRERHFVNHHLSQSRYFHINGDSKMHKILYRYDGLLLERNRVSKKLRVRNPSLRQVFELPDQREERIDIRLSYEPASGELKVVTVFDKKNGTGCGGFEVLALDSEEPSWRSINVPSLAGLNRKKEKILFCECREEGVTVLHCIRFMRTYYQVVSFNVKSECWTTTILDKNFFPDPKRVHAMSWDNRLALAEIVKEEIHALVLEDYKKQKWGREKVVVAMKFMAEDEYKKKSIDPVAVLEGDLWFWADADHMYNYQIQQQGVLNVKCCNKSKCTTVQDSLLTFRGMRPENGNQSKLKLSK